MLSSQVHEVKEPEYQSGENNRGLCDGTIRGRSEEEVDIRKTVVKNRKGKTTNRNAELEKERERKTINSASIASNPLQMSFLSLLFPPNIRRSRLHGVFVNTTLVRLLLLLRRLSGLVAIKAAGAR